MDTPSQGAPEPVAAAGDPSLPQRLACAERLLACFQKALGHDLPGRLVALQGLLRLLEAEAGPQLDDETRTYLQRSLAVAGKAALLVRELADLGRAARDAATAAEVPLSEAAEEALVAGKQLFPTGSSSTIS